MTERDLRPEAGGNTDQPDDGRDENGRLPEPLDAAHFGNPDGPAIVVPGMPLSQPAGTGPVVSSPVPEPPKDEADVADAEATGDADADAATTADDSGATPGAAATSSTATADPAKPSGLATMPRAGG